jgi:hypothetical protein
MNLFSEIWIGSPWQKDSDMFRYDAVPDTIVGRHFRASCRAGSLQRTGQALQSTCQSAGRPPCLRGSPGQGSARSHLVSLLLAFVVLCSYYKPFFPTRSRLYLNSCLSTAFLHYSLATLCATRAAGNSLCNRALCPSRGYAGPCGQVFFRWLVGECEVVAGETDSGETRPMHTVQITRCRFLEVVFRMRCWWF